MNGKLKLGGKLGGTNTVGGNTDTLLLGVLRGTEQMLLGDSYAGDKNVSDRPSKWAPD